MKTLILTTLMAACSADTNPVADGHYVLTAGEGVDTCDGRPWQVTPGGWAFELADGTADVAGCALALEATANGYRLAAPTRCGNFEWTVFDLYLIDGVVTLYAERAVDFSFGTCDGSMTFSMEAK